ncbi:hypothetical protein ACX80Z_15840 [Arthrobacter sp. TMT4-20]
MGKLEDAAAEIIAQQTEDERRRQAHRAEVERWQNECRQLMTEFLEVVQREDYRPEKTYNRHTVLGHDYRIGGGGVVSFELTDVEGWIIDSETPGEYDSCAAKGTLITRVGDCYAFTAHYAFDHKRVGEKPTFSRYYRFDPSIRPDVVIILGRKLIIPMMADWTRSLARSLATYMTVSVA